MDIKHVLSRNPLLPGLRAAAPAAARRRRRPVDLDRPRRRHGRRSATRGGGFGFDNEFPRHLVHLEPFALADRPVTCGEWLAFIDDGGYRRPELWLSDGWATVQAERLGRPALLVAARRRRGTSSPWPATWPVDPARPVCHVSYYEADAFARWAGHRLPTEAEWEVVTPAGPTHRRPATSSTRPCSIPRPPSAARRRPFGDVWQWTSSAYSPYPGFAPAPGAVGEYNGKFMVNQ